MIPHKQLKPYAKTLESNNDFNPYKAAYGTMPSHAIANPAIQQMYINGHFCYTYKFGIVTNGLGIIRHISFYNKDFLDAHPEVIIEKKINRLTKINHWQMRKHSFQHWMIFSKNIH